MVMRYNRRFRNEVGDTIADSLKFEEVRKLKAEQKIREEKEGTDPIVLERRARKAVHQLIELCLNKKLSTQEIIAELKKEQERADSKLEPYFEKLTPHYEGYIQDKRNQRANPRNRRFVEGR